MYLRCVGKKDLVLSDYWKLIKGKNSTRKEQFSTIFDIMCRTYFLRFLIEWKSKWGWSFQPIILHLKHQSRSFNDILHEYLIFHRIELVCWNYTLVLKLSLCCCLCDSSYWDSGYRKFELLKIRLCYRVFGFSYISHLKKFWRIKKI